MTGTEDSEPAVIDQKATYELELEMEPGAKRVVVGVRDHIGASESSVSVDVVVGPVPAAS